MGNEMKGSVSPQEHTEGERRTYSAAMDIFFDKIGKGPLDSLPFDDETKFSHMERLAVLLIRDIETIEDAVNGPGSSRSKVKKVQKLLLQYPVRERGKAERQQKNAELENS